MEIKKLVLIVFLPLLILVLVPNSLSQYNFEYKNVTSRVNVTNAFPTILNVFVDQDVTLNAGGTKRVYCNATVRDWNGWDDVDFVNATLYHSSSTHGSGSNGNAHYTNTSCENTGNDGEYISEFSCSFDLIHYANNGTWTCNVTAQDLFGFTDNLSNITTVNELYALNVTDLIDYGDLAVTDTSAEVTSVITNFGNMNIGVSVLGYGLVEGDGYGLICELGGNIGVEFQRFSSVSGGSWNDKTPLSISNQDLGIMIPQANDSSAPTFADVFWQLYVPPNPQGECNGTIRFTATPYI